MDWFEFILILGALLGMGLLLVAHFTHRQQCVRLGKTPQAFPYLIFGTFAVGLLAVLILMGQ